MKVVSSKGYSLEHLFVSPFALPPNPLKGEPPPRNSFDIVPFVCFNLLRTVGLPGTPFQGS